MSTGVQEAVTKQQASALCVTCGTLLEGGYCHECGEKQPNDHDLTVKHFAHDAWHEIVHVDSKIWRTLKALITKPGLLTEEYRAGRKNKYVRPLRLYVILFAGFVLLFSIGSRTRTFDVERVLESETKRGSGGVMASPTGPGANVNLTSGGQKAPKGTLNYAVEKLIRSHLKRDGYGEVAPDNAVYKIARAAAIDKMTKNWQRYTSLLQFVQPLLLSLGLMLLFWGAKRHYVEHLVMALHLLSFQYLWSILCWPVYMITGLDPLDRSPAVMGIGIAVSLVYVFLAFRRYYGESKVRTGVKSVMGYGMLFAGVVAPTAIALVVAIFVA